MNRLKLALRVLRGKPVVFKTHFVSASRPMDLYENSPLNFLVNSKRLRNVTVYDCCFEYDEKSDEEEKDKWLAQVIENDGPWLENQIALWKEIAKERTRTEEGKAERFKEILTKVGLNPNPFH